MSSCRRDSAAAIGWAPSPFQFEVGVANLGIALASFYAAFMGYQARGAVAVAAACFLGGAGVGHLIDIALGDNFAAGNAGPILITDFLTPIAVLALLVAFPPATKARVQAKAQQSLEQRIAATADKASAPRTENAPRRVEDELEQARVSMRDQLGARSDARGATRRQALARGRRQVATEKGTGKIRRVSRQCLANTSVPPSFSISSTSYGSVSSPCSMPGEPMGMPGTVKPTASGRSAMSRLMSVAGTWPSTM